MNLLISLEDLTQCYLPSLFFVLLLIVGIFLCGLLARSVFFWKINITLSVSEFVYSLLVGLVVIVFAVSIVKTHFNTINILFIWVFIGLFYKRKSLLQLPPTPLRINLFLVVVFFVFIYSVCFFIHYQSLEHNPLSYIRTDDLFYSLISHHIFSQGIENTSHVVNYITGSDSTSLNYYHYFELWLTGFANSLDNKNINTTFVLHVGSLVNFIASISIYFLLSSYLKDKKIILFLVLVFIAFSPITLPFYKNIFAESLEYEATSILFGKHYTTNVKFTILLIPFLIFFYFLLKKELFLSSILLTVIIIFTATVLPTFAILSLALFVYAFWLKDKDTWKIFVYNGVFFLAFVAFYYFKDGFNDNLEGEISFSLWQEIYYHIRIPLSLTTKQAIYLFWYLLLLFLLCGRNFLFKYKKILLFYVASIFSFSVVGSLFYKKINYIQIANIPSSLMAYAIFIYLSAQIFVELNRTRKIIFVSVLSLISAYNVYVSANRLTIETPFIEKEFVKEFDDSFEDNKKLWGVSITKINSTDPYQMVSMYSSPFNFFSEIRQGVFSLSLSHYGVSPQGVNPIDSMNIEWALQKDPFSKFVLSQKRNQEFVSLNQSRLDFILEYKPSFLVVRDEKFIPNNFRPYSRKRIINKKGSVIVVELEY